jgi:hypothetical protein
MLIHTLQLWVELELAWREPFPQDPAWPGCTFSGGDAAMLALACSASHALVGPASPWLRLLCPPPPPPLSCNGSRFTLSAVVSSSSPWFWWVYASPCYNSLVLKFCLVNGAIYPKVGALFLSKNVLVEICLNIESTSYSYHNFSSFLAYQSKQFVVLIYWVLF